MDGQTDGRTDGLTDGQNLSEAVGGHNQKDACETETTELKVKRKD